VVRERSTSDLALVPTMTSILDLPEEIILCLFEKLVFGVDCFANRKAL
jgi:hypothetical protein